MRLAEKRGLMKLPFDPAPQIAVPAETLVEHYGYQHRRANYLAGARMEGDTLILTAYTHDGKPLYRTFQQPDDLFSQFPASEKPSDATLSTIFGQYHGVYHMTAEDTNLIRAWCKNNAPFSFSSDGDTGYKILRDYQKRLREEQLARPARQDQGAHRCEDAADHAPAARCDGMGGSGADEGIPLHLLRLPQGEEKTARLV